MSYEKTEESAENRTCALQLRRKKSRARMQSREHRESNLRVIAEEEAGCQAVLRVEQYSGGHGRLFQYRVGLRGPEGGLVVGAQLVQGVHLACEAPKP